MSAARESDQQLEGRFGQELLKVALEPGCRKRVSIHDLSPLQDKILMGIYE